MMMKKHGKCNEYCDMCSRSICVYGNPTLEPDPEELDELLDELMKEMHPVSEAAASDGPEAEDK